MIPDGSSADVEAALDGGVVIGSVDLDVITVTGADAVDYLQGQLSQNVAGLAIGETRWTLLLQPQGKVDAWMRIHRIDPDRLWLVVDAGYGDDALARLERFKLRVDVTFALGRVTAVALRGEGSHQAASKAGGAPGHRAVDAGWGSVPGVDLIADGDEPPDPESVARLGAEEVAGADAVVVADAASMELIRILQGRPLMGRELDSSTIPAAAGIVDESVDFTKGCYVGQELVARIDSRGSNTPTRLVRFVGTPHSAGSEGTISGAGLTIDGSDAGSVTSAASSPSQGLVGLAYVKRAVDVPGRAELDWPDGPLIVELIPLRAE